MVRGLVNFRAMQCLFGCSFLFSEVLFSFGGLFVSGSGGRDARPCGPRVRNVRCPASALTCIEPGPLGDASGKLSPVLASVNAVVKAFAGVLCAPSCWVVVKYVTDGVRVFCDCGSCGVRAV